LLKHVMQQRDQNTSLQLTNAMEQSPSWEAKCMFS
jgi:hypothetical protein